MRRGKSCCKRWSDESGSRPWMSVPAGPTSTTIAPERQDGRSLLHVFVVDVPVLFSDKFLQFFEFFVPQVQFLDRTVDIPVVQQRQVPTVFFTFLVHFLGKVVVPVLRNDRDMVRQCRIPCWCRSCRSSLVVDIPFVPQSQFPYGLAWSEDHRGSSVAVRSRWSMPLLRMSCWTCKWLCNDRCSWFR